MAWWRAFSKAWSACGPVTRSVKAISIAAQQHGLVALDGDGDPVHPAKLWNDSESAPQSDALTRRLGARSGPGDAAASSPRRSPSRNGGAASATLIRRPSVPCDAYSYLTSG